jgi:hypothetical protein
MPVLSAKTQKDCWVQYVNDSPINVKPYKDQDRVWDYSKSKFLALSTETRDYLGRPMPLYTGNIVNNGAQIKCTSS